MSSTKLLRNYNSALRYGAKILPSEILGGGFSVFGNVYYVDATNGNDDYDGKSPTKAFKTIPAAYEAVTTNNDDVIVLSAYAAHAITSMLTITKNRVHFVSAGMRGGAYGMGARTRITMGSSTVAADIALMQNTGVGNTFEGIKFDSSSVEALSLYTVAEGGEYSVYTGCEFYKSTDLDETAAAEVLNNGDSAQWIRCTFGSDVNEVADNKIRPNILLTREAITGKVCRSNIIDDCEFLVKAAGTEAVRIYGAGATDVERSLRIYNSKFISNTLGAATPAHAVGFGAAQTQGTVILKDCMSVDHTVMVQAAVGIAVAGAVPTFATTGVAKTS